MIIVDESLPVGELPPPFPPRDVEVKLEENIREAYDMKKEIGRGRFGTVYLCTCKKTNLNFAAKFVNTKRKQDRRNVEREIEIMKTLSDKGARQKLIQLYDAYDMGKEMCLVLEIVEGGELFERVTDDDFELTERACAIFIRQICEAIEYVHSKNILHLDMKPENILCLSREGNRVKICDFGLARKYDPRKKLQVLFGTPEFVAPEVVNFEPINFGTDMWSIGVITYVLLSGLSPFMGHNYVETMTNVTHNKYDFDDEAFDEVSDDAKDFIERLLLLDKSERMTPQICYRHRWLKNLESMPKYHNLNIDVKKSSMEELNSISNMESEMETISTSSTEIIIDGKLNIPLKDPKLINNEVKNEEITPTCIDKKEIPENKRDLDKIHSSSEERKLGISPELSKVSELSNKRKSFEVSEKRKDSIIINTSSSSIQDEDHKNKNNNSQSADDQLKTKFLKTDQELAESKSEAIFPANKGPYVLEEQELDLTKENLKEFVERWHSQSSSPNAVGSPKSKSIICQLGDELYSQPSLLKPNSPTSPIIDTQNIDNNIQIKVNANTKVLPPLSKNSEINLAEELEKRLLDLKDVDTPGNLSIKENSKDCKGIQKKIEETKQLERKETQNKDGTKALSRKPSDKENYGGKLKPSRDVINQPSKNVDSEKNLGVSPVEKTLYSPSKLSRRASKEREDRPPSRDSNRSTPAKVRRRPSRDVPMSLTQCGRLNSVSGVKGERRTTLDLWPDMICLSKDEQDSSDPSENESEGKPITGKLQLPVTAAPSSALDAVGQVPIQLKNAEFRKRRSYDESNNLQKEKQTVTWMLDLNGVRIPDEINSRTNTNEKGNDCKNTNKEKLITTTNTDDKPHNFDKNNSSVQTSKMSSAGSSKCNSYENLIIQTPWGPMRRSPSKSSLKGGDNTTIINISDCFINVTKPTNDNKINSTTSSINIIPSKTVDKNKILHSTELPTSQERRKSFIQQNQKVNHEITAENTQLTTINDTHKSNNVLGTSLNVHNKGTSIIRGNKNLEEKYKSTKNEETIELKDKIQENDQHEKTLSIKMTLEKKDKNNLQQENIESNISKKSSTTNVIPKIKMTNENSNPSLSKSSNGYVANLFQDKSKILPRRSKSPSPQKSNLQNTTTKKEEQSKSVLQNIIDKSKQIFSHSIEKQEKQKEPTKSDKSHISLAKNNSFKDMKTNKPHKNEISCNSTESKDTGSQNSLTRPKQLHLVSKVNAGDSEKSKKDQESSSSKLNEVGSNTIAKVISKQNDETTRVSSILRNENEIRHSKVEKEVIPEVNSKVDSSKSKVEVVNREPSIKSDREKSINEERMPPKTKDHTELNRKKSEDIHFIRREESINKTGNLLQTQQTKENSGSNISNKPINDIHFIKRNESGNIIIHSQSTQESKKQQISKDPNDIQFNKKNAQETANSKESTFNVSKKLLPSETKAKLLENKISDEGLNRENEVAKSLGTSKNNIYKVVAEPEKRLGGDAQAIHKTSPKSNNQTGKSYALSTSASVSGIPSMRMKSQNNLSSWKENSENDTKYSSNSTLAKGKEQLTIPNSNERVGRHSLTNDDKTIGRLRRISKSPQPSKIATKGMLFSAQERISQFEKFKEEKPENKTPISPQNGSKPGSRPVSICEKDNSKPMNSKSEYSTIKAIREQLMKQSNSLPNNMSFQAFSLNHKI